MKNDNIHTFHFMVSNFEFAGFAPKQKYTAWTVSMENPDRERTNQSQSERKDFPKTGFAM